MNYLTAAPFQDPVRIVTSAWNEHIPFMFWLMDVLRPEVFVELGTHNGMSFSAACQIANSESMHTKLFAVDTWAGDHQAGHYSDKVYENLKAYLQEKYNGTPVLIRSTFDDALEKFEDSSIDLLHIDGLHTYEAVKNDYESWRPKMRDGGVILFHDTNVRRDDFGVYRLWEEIRDTGPSLEFLHGFGLGVLVVGKEIPAPLIDFFEQVKTVSGQKEVRHVFSHLGKAVPKPIGRHEPFFISITRRVFQKLRKLL
jgi:predicted O-methyltransferase YrrM